MFAVSGLRCGRCCMSGSDSGWPAFSGISRLARIGHLAIEVAEARRAYRAVRWKDCENYEPDEDEVGFPGSPACPFPDEGDAPPVSEWCDSCQLKATLRVEARRAVRRLSDVVRNVEKKEVSDG